MIILGALLLPVGYSAAQSSTTARAAILPDFQFIRQGKVGVVRVSGAEVAEVRAVFQERVHYFYRDGSQFIGLLAADVDSKIEPYPIQFFIKYADDTAERVDQEIKVESGEYGSGPVTLSARLAPLLEPDVETAEMDRLFNIMDRFTPVRYWADNWFIPPSTDVPIGWFGTQRLFNDTYWRRHTGVDVRMPIGTPVIAMADGRVMLTETLDIRGNYLLIDHGWGVYTGYAHLSEFMVVPGQWVRQGDVIGLSGLNGRSQGAHLHWEMVVAGTWVDPEQFLDLGLVDTETVVNQP